jgi:hypothetical protein
MPTLAARGQLTFIHRRYVIRPCKETSRVASLYTFHSFNDAQAPLGLQVFELDTDAAAVEQAAHVLAEHASAARVLVFQGDREVATRQRTPPSRALPSSCAWG